MLSRLSRIHSRPKTLLTSTVSVLDAPFQSRRFAAAPRSLLANVAELSKARLSALVVLTTSCGFLSAGLPLYVSVPTLVGASVGTALCASSAGTINQVLEVDRDRKMKRTRHRPLPSGEVSVTHASVLAAATGTLGGTVLYLTTDPLTTVLGVGNIALYAPIYTISKRSTEWNTWVGAIVGAIPPVMGWTASGGSLLDPECLFLGSSLFLWQFPHFFALSWMHRKGEIRRASRRWSCSA